MTKKKGSMMGNMIAMGVGNIVGATMIGASAGAVAALPAGAAKTVAGLAPTMQSVALVGYNVKHVKKALPKNKGVW